MALSNFQKFLEEKKAGKNGGDPAPKVKMSVVPDYTGKKSDTPPGGGKSYGSGKGVGKDFSEAPKGEAKGESLADKGDKSLKYSPATPYKSTVDLKPVKGEKKLKSESFVDATKGLTPTQFAEFMAKKNTNLGEVHGVVGQFSNLVKGNPSGVLALVSEARRNGYFRVLMAEMLQYPESMQIVAKLLGDKTEGLAAARRLVKAMNEMVGPPMHQTLGAGAPPKKGLPAPGAGGPDAMGGEEDPDALGGEEDMDMDDPDAMGDDLGGEDDEAGLDDGEGDDLGDEEDMDMDDPDAMGDDLGGEDDMGGEDDPDAMGGPDAGGLGAGPDAGGKKPFQMKLPRPSMMHRMMRPESTSPAVQNFMRALQG